MRLVKSLIIVYMIGVFVNALALGFFMHGVQPGNFYLFGNIIGIFTIVPFNTFFVYILHKFGIINIYTIGIGKIVTLCVCCLSIPPFLHFVGCTYFYDYVFIDLRSPNGTFTHKHAFWFNPIVLYLYNYFFVFIFLWIRHFRQV